jgi:GNAT superfamily N-acetyltransferase
MTTAGEITTSIPTPEELQFLDDRIYEHNCARTGRDDGQLLGLFVRNEQQEIVAGLSGWTWAEACQIENLWVHAAARGQGLGRALLDGAEREARDRGCTVITLNTYSFQALEFYRRAGYEVVCSLHDFPPGHDDNWLVKRL